MAGEKKLQQLIVKRLEEHDVLIYKFESPGRRGVPDLLCFPMNKPAFLIEVKNPNKRGRLSAMQMYQADKIQHQGTAVYIVNDADMLPNIISRSC